MLRRRHRISPEEIADQQQKVVDSHFQKYESEHQLNMIKEAAAVLRGIREENHIVKDLRKVLLDGN
jgi:hypothetical protein